MLIAVHWDQKGHSISTPWQRTDKEVPFSKLGLPAASDGVWHIGQRSRAKGKKFHTFKCSQFLFSYKYGGRERQFFVYGPGS